MYRCGPDGRNIHPVSCNIEQDNTPWMMPDGRVLYMRWEYVDRSRVKFHHLWTANPDGTGAMVFFGNLHPGTVMLDAKPIRGTDKVLSIFSPGHGRKEHAGRLAIVDPDAGPDELECVRFVGKGSSFRDPYPISENLFLAADNDRVLLVDGQGNTEQIASPQRAGMWLHEPRPVVARPREPVIPSRTDYTQAVGRLALADVTHGRNMAGVNRGEIKKLLVMETLPKPANFSGTMEPLSMGGTFTLPRILGTVPVEPDGSAYFDVPALRPVFFVALDANDLSVMRMQSFTSVMPGETTSCVGCHDNRTDTTTQRRSMPLAMRKPPAHIEPITDVPDVIDFPRDVQPILKKHCVRCHDCRQKDPPPKLLSLAGDYGPWYSHSYAAIMSRGLVAHGRDALGNRQPRTIGSSASPLMRYIEPSHEGVKLTPLERKTVRLWIETGATYPGTYAALGTGMVNNLQPDRASVQRRCASCHANKSDRSKNPPAQFRTNIELLVNLTAPDRSLVLLAPLAKEAGGWGLCTSDKAPGGVFASKDDPDYRRILATIDAARQSLLKMTRFDMPSFRPNGPYVREMKRFGILPASAGKDGRKINVYATDQAYWKSFWFKPRTASAGR